MTIPMVALCFSETFLSVSRNTRIGLLLSVPVIIGVMTVAYTFLKS